MKIEEKHVQIIQMIDIPEDILDKTVFMYGDSPANDTLFWYPLEIFGTPEEVWREINEYDYNDTDFMMERFLAEQGLTTESDTILIEVSW